LEQLIDFHAPEVQAVLDTLLKDKSTGKNIIWATDPPEELQTVMYEPVTDRSQITTQQLGLTHYEVVLPRMMKQTDTQQQRTRKKGEVFSPAWVCNKMNNALDADWFRGLGAEESAGQFTVELLQGWQTVETPVQFPVCKGRTPAWVQYVQSRRLEVTCGEAPFLASRYDAATGEMIPVARRIGILDRKLRVVSENAATEDEWHKYATHAVQSTYGYEYQGDNLLLARVNLLLTYAEHLQARWQRKPTKEELQPIANIISWNLWQMDGLHLSVPGGKPQPETEQLDLFSMFGAAEPQPPAVSCKVKNWRKGSHGTAQNFETIQEGSTSMKFDYVIGNPPYQDEMEGTSDNPVYNLFMDATYPMASVVELITPARFLFNAGKTPKTWNEKMLNDEHLKVLYYEQNSAKIFNNTDIKGGVVITYHDREKECGAIQIFTAYPLLNTIIQKVKKQIKSSLSDIVFAPESYKFTKQMYVDHPEILSMTMISKGKEVPLISKGHDYDLTSNIFDKLYNIVFFETKQGADECVEIFGRKSNECVCLYVNRKYIAKHPNLDKYKLFFPKANGSGRFGEVMTDSDIGEKGVGHTQTFISIGAFDTREEAKNLQKYLKCKLARALLYVLKVTQDNKKSVWKYVPLQDFTAHSDIDWSKSVAEIDQQLYRKYDLTADEIEFIETHVKEMA
jgi:hypothetical protein